MCEVVKVLERELENSGLIYVYQEGGEGKWYVYERSAYFLSRMMEGVVLERYVMDNTLWLVRAEVDVDCIPHDTILSYSSKEYVLKYSQINNGDISICIHNLVVVSSCFMWREEAGNRKC